MLLAVESGSRAWGFASPDSDYDVRFVYVRSVGDYLRLRPMRDVIELPIREDLDIVGWDLHKALGLLIKPNPVLLEWLGSPVRYHWGDGIGGELTALAADTGYHRACTADYARLAAGEWRSHIEGRAQVSLKGYLYATRATLCVRWLLAGRDGPPPVRLRDVLPGTRLSPAMVAAIEQLVAQKRLGTERVTGPRRPLLDQLHLETQDQVGDLPQLSHPPYCGRARMRFSRRLCSDTCDRGRVALRQIRYPKCALHVSATSRSASRGVTPG